MTGSYERENKKKNDNKNYNYNNNQLISLYHIIHRISLDWYPLGIFN
jgi:hypothetical protein